MHCIIDRDLQQIVAKVEKADHAVMMELVYYKDSPTIVCNTDVRADWSKLDRMEALMLLKHHTGIVEDIHNYPAILDAVIAFAQNFPLTNVNVQSLEYSAGIMREQVLKPPSTPLVSDDRPASKPSNQAPSPKGATGRVWEIAEAVLTTVGSTDMKALRAAVIKGCTDAGIHEATAATQWSKWKKSKGL